MRTIRFLLKRFAAQRLLGLAIVVTLGFTIGVLVAGPIYADASREAILSSQVSTAATTVRNVRFSVYGGPDFGYAQANAQISDATRRLPLSSIVRQGSGTIRLAGTPPSPLSITVLFREGAIQHVPYRGEPPRTPAEIALPGAMARLLGVRIGDVVTAIGPAGASKPLTVVGTFSRPAVEDNEFWYGGQTPFPGEGRAPGTLGAANEMSPALMGPAGYLATVPALGVTSQYVWDGYVDYEGLTYAQANLLLDVGARIDETLRQANPELTNLQTATGIQTMIEIVRQRVQDLAVPIFLVVFQVGAVALAVLAGVGSLVLGRQSFELAVLRSRGFSGAKLLAGQTIQAVLLAAVAFPVGLLIGLGLARLASRSNGPSLPGVLFPIQVNGVALMLGIVGAALGALALVLLSLPHIQRTILEERRLLSREDRPLLARVPVEAFVLPLALFAFIELRSTPVASSLERTSLDPLVLLTPTLMIFGLSFLALRLLLFVLRRFDRRVGRSRRLPVYLAARRLGRSPGTSFATALLLVLSVGLLVVSTSYRATVLQNHADAAHQQVGADWNVQVAAPEQPIASLDRLPANATGVVRTEPSFEAQGSFSITPSAIAVDPSTYEDGGWWRADYSTTPEDTWLADLRTPDPAQPIPGGGSSELAVDAEAGRGAQGLELVATVQQPSGDVEDLVLGVLGVDESLSAPLDGATRLLSLSLRTPSTSAPDRAVVTIRSVGGQPAADALSGWEPLRWRGSDAAIRRDGDALVVTVDTGAGHVIGGIAPPMDPLPALVSPGVDSSQPEIFPVTLGGQRLEFRKVAVADHFPTVPGDFMVMSTPAILQAAARIPEPGLSLSEVWAMGDDPRAALQRSGFVIGATSAAAPIEGVLAQLPQSLAVGMNFATAVGGLILVVIGVAVGLYFAQRRREFEFASLRAMGAEPSQIARVLLLEQGLLIGFAIAVGAGLGFGILAWLMPYVGRSLGAPFPAPVLVVDWFALAAAFAAIVAATAIGLLTALRSLLRSSVTGVLRGEAE
jgi:hypothetical protein